MKRCLALLTLLALLLALPVGAAEAEETPWTRTEGDGSYVTIRVPCPEGNDMLWSEYRYLGVRYADTKEPVPLTGEFHQGSLFATVPANQACRPLEAFLGEPTQFNDCHTSWTQDGRLISVYDPPLGVPALNIRGVILGDGSGNLNPDEVITRAEAFTMICRLLSLEPEGDPGFQDVDTGDWFYDTASAAKAAGITNQEDYFYPDHLVTRGEFTVMLHRAMKAIGWMEDVGGAADDLSFADADSIPGWALGSYLAFDPHNVNIRTTRDSDIMGEFGPEQDFYAEHSKGATREEVINLVYDALRWVPYYPTQAAIDWGFDKEMPVIDGSTSTLPYTHAVYGALYTNGDNHPSYPETHSKSYYSYERLISGEADLLFIAAKPTQDTIDKAAAAGVELEFIPIAYDAMVFFTNGANPIDGLTTQQIKDIYVKNAYDNWADLGGPDAALIPYCRNADSGSQALMEEFFLEGGDIHPDIRKETTSLSMQSVLTDVEHVPQAMDDPAYGLGYSIYYYYQSASRILLSGDDSLKLLSIDGIAPDDAAIADGTYPLSGYNYIALRADEPEDSPARRMVDFMLSDRGQTCVINAGFGALRPTPEEYLSGLKAGDISSINWPVGREEQPTVQEVVSLLNSAAANILDEEPEGAAIPLLWSLSLELPPNKWSIIDTRITLEAGLTESLVKITGSDALPVDTVWVEDEGLYQLVRTCMDTPDGPIDRAALAKYQDTVDAELAKLPHLPSGSSFTVQQKLNAFYLLAENKAIDAQIYVVDILRATDPAEKSYVLLAGGQYVDSRLHIHGDCVTCMVTVDGQAVGTWYVYGDGTGSVDDLKQKLASFQTKAELLAALEP